jgi:hypothetical protein
VASSTQTWTNSQPVPPEALGARLDLAAPALAVAAQHPVPGAALGDPAELLDVDVD